jgi:hypothetical protein
MVYPHSGPDFIRWYGWRSRLIGSDVRIGHLSWSFPPVGPDLRILVLLGLELSSGGPPWAVPLGGGLSPTGPDFFRRSFLLALRAFPDGSRTPKLVSKLATFLVWPKCPFGTSNNEICYSPSKGMKGRSPERLPVFTEPLSMTLIRDFGPGA